MWPMIVVVADVLIQHHAQMPFTGDNGSCPLHTFCLFDTNRDAFPFRTFADSIIRNTCNPVSNPITSYIWNDSRVRWYVYTDSKCTQNRGIIYPNTCGNMGSPWNNNIRGVVRTSSLS
jgi:hypothetical protein